MITSSSRPSVWSDRVPAKYGTARPTSSSEDGREMWVWEGGELTMGLNAVAGKPREQWGSSRPASTT